MWMKSDLLNKLKEIQDFSEIWNFFRSKIKNSNKLNEILNKYGINSPQKTIYTSTCSKNYINEKKISYNDIINNWYDIFLNYLEYTENELFKNNNSINNITTELCNKVKVENNIPYWNINELYYECYIYIIKLFIFDSLNWILNELYIIEIFKNELKNKLYIYDKISWYLDNKYCVDFSIIDWNNKYIVWIQVKPYSFIKWINNTTSYSYQKIMKANNDSTNYLKWEYGIFICYIYNKQIFLAPINDLNNTYTIKDFIKNII